MSNSAADRGAKKQTSGGEKKTPNTVDARGSVFERGCACVLSFPIYLSQNAYFSQFLHFSNDYIALWDSIVMHKIVVGIRA